MRSDLTRVRQNPVNLLGNACTFTDHGRTSLDVSVERGDCRDEVVFAPATSA